MHAARLILISLPDLYHFDFKDFLKHREQRGIVFVFFIRLQFQYYILILLKGFVIPALLFKGLLH